MSNVYIYSRGAYENLRPELLEGKAVIRIHNIHDENWYPNEEDGKLILFFNDYKSHNLSWVQKIKGLLGFKTIYLNKQNTLRIIKYIKDNKHKEFIIHCEYGRSRSIAIGIFLTQQLGYKIVNKKNDELNQYNDWVLYLLKKFY